MQDWFKSHIKSSLTLKYTMIRGEASHLLDSPTLTGERVSSSCPTRLVYYARDVSESQHAGTGCASTDRRMGPLGNSYSIVALAFGNFHKVNNVLNSLLQTANSTMCQFPVGHCKAKPCWLLHLLDLHQYLLVSSSPPLTPPSTLRVPPIFPSLRGCSALRHREDTDERRPPRCVEQAATEERERAKKDGRTSRSPPTHSDLRSLLPPIAAPRPRASAGSVDPGVDTFTSLLPWSDCVLLDCLD